MLSRSDCLVSSPFLLLLFLSQSSSFDCDYTRGELGTIFQLQLYFDSERNIPPAPVDVPLVLADLNPKDFISFKDFVSFGRAGLAPQFQDLCAQQEARFPDKTTWGANECAVQLERQFADGMGKACGVLEGSWYHASDDDALVEEHPRPDRSGFPQHWQHGRTPDAAALTQCRELLVFAFVTIPGHTRNRDAYLARAVSLIPEQLALSPGTRCAVLFSDDRDFLRVAASAVKAAGSVLAASRETSPPRLGVLLTRLLKPPLPPQDPHPQPNPNQSPGCVNSTAPSPAAATDCSASASAAATGGGGGGGFSGGGAWTPEAPPPRPRGQLAAYTPRNAAIALDLLPHVLQLKDGSALAPGMGRLLAAAVWFQKLELCALGADLVPHALDVQWHDLSDRTNINVKIENHLPGTIYATTYPATRPLGSLSFGGRAPCAAFAHGSFLAMRAADAFAHAEAFHAALKTLAARGEQFLDEEIVLAYAANARGCNPDGSKLGGGNVVSGGSPPPAATAPPRETTYEGIRLVDLCSYPVISCTPSDDWNG